MSLNTLFSNTFNAKYKCQWKQVLIWNVVTTGVLQWRYCSRLAIYIHIYIYTYIYALYRTLVARHFRNQNLIFVEGGSCSIWKNPVSDSSDGAWNSAGTFSLAANTSEQVLTCTSLLCRSNDNTRGKSDHSFSSKSLLSVYALFHLASFLW